MGARSNTIYIQDGSAEEIVESLAHELGHINGPPINKLSREEFINSSLASEGAATTNTIKIRREILETTGTIDIASRFDEKDVFYESVYDEMLQGKISKGMAYEKIGKYYGDNEYPDSPYYSRYTYRDAYARMYHTSVRK